MPTYSYSWLKCKFSEKVKHLNEMRMGVNSVNVSGRNLGHLLVKEHDAYHSDAVVKAPPQVIQGMWQAYGQIRSAKIRGYFGLLGTGILGAALYFYREIISKDLAQKNEELAEKDRQLSAKELEINERDKRVKADMKVLLDNETKERALVTFLEKTNEDKDTKIESMCKLLFSFKNDVDFYQKNQQSIDLTIKEVCFRHVTLR